MRHSLSGSLKDTKISILYTIPNFVTAGSGRAMLNVIERLDRDRFAPSICVLKRGGDLERVVERLDVPLFHAPFSVPTAPFFNLVFRTLRAARQFNQQFDLWHSFHYAGDITEPFIARLAGTKAWLYTKKNMSWIGRRWRMRSFMARGIAVQNTEMARSFFRRALEKIRYIPPGVDANAFSPGPASEALRAAWGFPDGTVVFGHVANIVPVKNHTFLITALAKTRAPIGLVFAGDFLDAAYADQIKTLVHQLGLSSRVRFLGKVRDTSTLLRTVDGFVFASLQEACPVAVLEAMASGLASVVTEIPAMKDIHVASETALVTAPENVDAFALAMDELALDLSQRERLGAQARQRVQTRFTLEKEAADYQKFYSEILS